MRVVEPLGLLSHTWSLAIEEQFYIVWPLVLRWMLRSLSRASILAIVAAGAACSAILRAALWTGPDSFPRVFHGSDTRAEALLIGCLLALVLDARSRTPGSTGRTLISVAAAAGAAALAWLFSHASSDAAWMYRGGFSVAALSAVALVAALTTSPEGPIARALAARPLVAIGRISYGLYLWHWPIFLILAPQLTGFSAGATLVVRFTATFAAAVLSWVMLERPVLAWKRRWS
jgi:peptidoglycan/LPS O-acetylase OafA/YrhL